MMTITSFKKPTHLLKVYLARQYAKLYPKDTFIGIGGSSDKTITALVCEKVLSQKYKTITSSPRLDPLLNIPSTILRMTPAIKKAVLEMDFYPSLVQPKVVVITKISDEEREHLTNFIEQMPTDGVAILNFDDINSRKLAEICSGSVMYYGLDAKSCTVWAGNIKIENFKTTFELNLGVERVRVNFSLLGQHQVYPALAGAVLGVLEDIPLTKIKIALESVQPSEYDMQAFWGPNGSVILDDTYYNYSAYEVEAAIDTLLQIPARRRVLVLGEMRDLGVLSDRLHRQVAQKIYKEKIDLVFLGFGQTQIVADELKQLGFWEEKMEKNLQNSQIVAKLLKVLGTGDVCLIKGSRSIRLDEVVKRITKK